jgi:hypothetical protein
MVKKKITKKTKKQGKSKSINIINKIHIDQSKRTTAKGSNPKKSNIKTLPAFSSAPSSGGNYTRQIIQDPYYSQSQYENANMLRQYNNMIRQNNPQIGYGFQDKNRNDTLLLQDSPKTQLLDDGNESVIESVVDNALYDDPRTNGDSQNAINQFQPPPGQQLPQPYAQIEGKVTDDILKMMYSDQQYDDKGFKIFRDSDIEPEKYFNKKSGKWVRADSADIARERAKLGLELNIGPNYTREPYSINKMFREQTTDLYGQGLGWRSHIAQKEEAPIIPQEPKKRGRKKKN